jgi:hypothetical protein
MLKDSQDDFVGVHVVECDAAMIMELVTPSIPSCNMFL